MARTTLIVITEDVTAFQKAQTLAQSIGASVEMFSPGQWAEKQNAKVTTLPALASGSHPVVEGGKVIQFPTAPAQDSGSVESMNDLEAKAIENAIHAFRGNLTEAARALGIGRATLYRKVKQYNIDPSMARKKKVA